MAVRPPNNDESKRMRKMSLSYIKDSFARRTSKQNGPRSHVCFCETLDDANGVTDGTSFKCSKQDISFDVDSVKCKCQNRSVNEKHKPGLLKSLKMRFQWRAGSMSARPISCKSKTSVKVLDSSSTSYSHLNDDSSSEGFTPANPRKVKQARGRSSVCSMPPPLRFIRSVDNKDHSKSTSNSRIEDDIFYTTTDRMTAEEEVAGNSNYMHSVEASENNNKSIMNDHGARNSEDISNPRLSEIKCDKGSVHNILLNLDKNVVQYESCDIIRHSSGDSALSIPSPATRSLTCELFKLAKYGWYWGPISREEAEEKLLNLPDGTFLVRDSSADRYLLSVSFRSSGKTFHTRIEHSHGLFSFYSNPGHEGFASIIELINHSMSYSESAVFCYSRPRAPGHPAFPVRLAKPVSRFTQVRSLQYLCRFVIRQYTRVDNIQKLPLPTRLKGYIQEGHY